MADVTPDRPRLEDVVERLALAIRERDEWRVLYHKVLADMSAHWEAKERAEEEVAVLTEKLMAARRPPKDYGEQ